MGRAGLRFSDIPLLFKVLRSRGYTPIEAVAGDMLRCEHSGEEWLLKACNASEELMYTKVLPAIKSRGCRFKTLVLPEAKEVFSLAPRRRVVVMKSYRGRTFNEDWSEQRPGVLGGRGLDPILVRTAVSMLEDLRRIDTAPLNRYRLLRFDLSVWLRKNLPVMLKDFLRRQLLSEGQCAKFQKALGSRHTLSTAKMMLANGDFYPRNFILLADGRAVLLDWEARTDIEAGARVRGMRNSLLAPPELHVAFLWVHMWGNPAFQERLLKTAVSRMRLGRRSLDLSIAIRSLEQAYFWLNGESYLMKRMLDCAWDALP